MAGVRTQLALCQPRIQETCKVKHEGALWAALLVLRQSYFFIKKKMHHFYKHSWVRCRVETKA